MDLGSAELDQLLSQAQRTVESMRSSRGPGSDARGRSGDGRVRAVAVSPGRLESLELDPRVMRMASADLAAQVVVAVNAALDDLAAQAPRVDGVDGQAVAHAGELAAAIADVREQSVRQMAAISQAITAAVQRVKEAM